MASAPNHDTTYLAGRPALAATSTTSSYGSVTTTTSTESTMSVSSQQTSFFSLKQKSFVVETLFHHSHPNTSTPPISIPSPTSNSAQTSPVTPNAPLHHKSRRTTSDSAIDPPVDLRKKSHIIQKSKISPCSTAHYGRHSNDWLFKNISIRGTVKHFVRGDDEHK